jgi:glycerol-3-phosphate dehydrogenase
MRGIDVALIERNEWGSGTTANWLRIVHGGFRYLQHVDLPRFMESIRERRWFLKNYPDLVRPFRFVMPLYKSHSYPAALMKAGLLVNDALSWRRNKDLPEACHIPPGRLVSATEVLDALPYVYSEGLTGGVEWHDAIVEQPELLLQRLLNEARSLGAHTVDNTEAIALHREGRNVAGLSVRDSLDQGEYEIATRRVVNACGHWGLELARRFETDVPGYPGNSHAWNILFDIPNSSDCGGAIKASQPGAQPTLSCPGTARRW